LEPKIPLFDAHAGFYYLLGLAYYHQHDINTALLYWHKGSSCDPQHMDLKLCIAVAALRQRDSTLAVRMWLEVLDIDPDHKQAHAGLNQLRSMMSSAEMARFVRSKKLLKLLPKQRFFVSPATQRLLIAMVITAGLGLLIWLKPPILIKSWPSLSGLRNQIYRKGAEQYDFVAIAKSDYIATPGDYAYQLDTKTIQVTMNKARDAFNAYKDNLVRHELNKIKYSNASDRVKRQAVLLATSLKEPSLNNLDTNYTYREVIKNPLLYQDCYVLWRGIVKDVKIGATAIQFMLLVGYQDGKIVEGEVEVQVPFEAEVDPLYVTDVLAKLKIDSSKRIWLEAVSLHQILK
jgi:tetratricopeptide (TPR) repeat protein